MPVPSSINDLSTTAGSNYPQGSDTPSTGDDVIRALSSFIATLRDQLNGTGAITTPTINGAVTFGEGWSLDTSGRLRNTSNEMPAFFAYKPSVPSTQTSGAAVTFSSEVFDQGSAFDGTTGVFTAPVAGVYTLSAKVRIVNGSAGTAGSSLYISGSTAGVVAGAAFSLAAGGTFDAHLANVCRLAASETVSVVLHGGSSFSAGGFYIESGIYTRDNIFSGALLY